MMINLIKFLDLFKASVKLETLTWWNALSDDAREGIWNDMERFISKNDKRHIEEFTSWMAGIYGIALEQVKDDRRIKLVQIPNDRTGWPYNSNSCVYLITCVETPGLYKIGAASMLWARLDGLQTSLPFQIVVAHVITTPDYERVERDLHGIFQAKRVRGEWFRLTEADVQYIREYTTVDATTHAAPVASPRGEA